jgi:hypothetical protein
LHKLRFQLLFFFDGFILIRPFCLFICLIVVNLLGLLRWLNNFFGWYLRDMLWHSRIQIVRKSLNGFIDSIKLFFIKNVNSWVDLKPKLQKIHELDLGVQFGFFRDYLGIFLLIFSSLDWGIFVWIGLLCCKIFLICLVGLFKFGWVFLVCRLNFWVFGWILRMCFDEFGEKGLSLSLEFFWVEIILRGFWVYKEENLATFRKIVPQQIRNNIFTVCFCSQLRWFFVIKHEQF